ncbi:uncharacterized protein PV06_10652 [Exophiala oligosperma]|uniref:Beta-lactamase-related domain-containing protein n=1 Tax=Exophiala oligosperma TaxID=215243 RepID=A0A0D2DMT9_9EURO|nr:uncharacterized protein PV06_10652 [Exophiala oligosperma]KIW37019.1 hypothetical protein PV06_10652 [Exophiala oligosperma]
MAKAQGECHPCFDALRAELEKQIASGDELGASIVLNVDGTNVVDIWAGYTDEARTKPWTKDTITNVWSCTKTVATLAALLQVSRGKLDLDAPVAQYWPEFAQNGKEKVLVRHFLSHTAGLPGWTEPITVEELCDLKVSTDRLEKQAPVWEPGRVSGYHAISQGHLIGELIRRTSGKTMKQFVADEIAGPLQADFQIGAVEEDWSRIAPIIPAPTMPIDFASLDPKSPTFMAFANPPLDATWALRPKWRRADLSGANGHANARSLVRILSSITKGGTNDGVENLTPQIIEKIFEVQADGMDVVDQVPLRSGIGYGLTGGTTSQSIDWLPQGRVCFWGGWGGSLILMDLDRKVTFSYVMNKMGSGIFGSERTEAYTRIVYKALGVEGF